MLSEKCQPQLPGSPQSPSVTASCCESESCRWRDNDGMAMPSDPWLPPHPDTAAGSTVVTGTPVSPEVRHLHLSWLQPRLQIRK